MEGLFAQNLNGFKKAALRLIPTPKQEKPVLDHDEQKFGIQFTQDLGRTSGVSLV
jgi:hypothetical protein